MSTNFIQDILLVQEPAAVRFYKEIMTVCGYFLAPLFSVALLLEYFGAMDFGGVVKRLLIIAVVMNSFYYIHTTASDASMEAASDTLKRISPRNLFMKKWTEKKVKMNRPFELDFIWMKPKDSLNDLLGTALFLASKVFFIILKLFYSTVYHLNYAFVGYTSLCFFFNWTQGALKGTILTTVWCVLEPWVLVGVLCIVGNSFDDSSLRGELVGSGVDHLAWLFGVSFLIVATPMITYTLINGGGMQATGAKVSELVMGAGLKAMTFTPMVNSVLSNASTGIGKLGSKAFSGTSLSGPSQNETNGGKYQTANQFNQKARVEKSFKGKEGFNEEIAEAGLSENHAINSSGKPNYLSASGSNKRRGTKGRGQFKKVTSKQKQTFEFDPGYWNSLDPQHKDAIRKQYGIESDTPNPHIRYYPVSTGKPMKKLSQNSGNGPASPKMKRINARRKQGAKSLNDRLRRIQL